jgi:23S rRNA (guanosine2251-2'-O)-methyltransferase
VSEHLFRRNTVLEALQGDRRELRKLWLQEGLRMEKIFLRAAESRGVPVEMASKAQLTRMAGDSSHQGVLLEAGTFPYSSLEEILELARERDEPPFLLLLDLLQGPQNIGTLLRAAEACGVHGVLVQDRRAPEMTPRVVMFSAGAAEHLLVAQVTNLARTIEDLRAADIWIAGLDLVDEAQTLGQIDLNMPLGIVVGHEGVGLRRLVRERCDFLLRLPMRGRVTSLNAATAGSIVLYAAWQARGYPGAQTRKQA